MRVLCTSTPMEGVVGPLLPIAHALRERGHEVVLAVGPDVQGRVEEAQLEATVVGPPAMEAVMRTMSDPAAAESPGAGPRFGAVMFGEVFAPDLLPQLRVIADEFVPDAVVHPPVEAAAPIVAPARGIPRVTNGVGPLRHDAMVRARGAGRAAAGSRRSDRGHACGDLPRLLPRPVPTRYEARWACSGARPASDPARDPWRNL